MQERLRMYFYSILFVLSYGEKCKQFCFRGPFLIRTAMEIDIIYMN